MEFSQRDDHAQGGAGAGGRLHHGDQAGDLHTVFGARAVRARRARRHPARRGIGGDRSVGPDRQGTHLQSDRAQVHIYRLDRSRQAADGAVRGHRQESLARTRRQRAVYRIRRCRYRRCDRGRDGIEIPQYRPDVRLLQPVFRAGKRLRQIRAEAQRKSRRDESRQWHRGRRNAGAADRHEREWRKSRSILPTRLPRARAS